jgi:hypothetical protein
MVLAVAVAGTVVVLARAVVVLTRAGGAAGPVLFSLLLTVSDPVDSLWIIHEIVNKQI